MNGKWAVQAVAVALAATSAFAADRGRGGYDNDRNHDSSRYERRNDSRGNNGSRSITMEGRVRSVRSERNGYRVELDRGGYSFFVPRSYRRANELRVGINIRLSGIFDAGYGYVNVSNADWLDDAYYGRGGYDNSSRGYVSGRVERVDLRRGVLLLRDDREGRVVEVAMLRTDSRWNRRIDLDDLRPGDRVELSGDWRRGFFEAYRIDAVRSGRY
jgi:hypothetical protein